MWHSLGVGAREGVHWPRVLRPVWWEDTLISFCLNLFRQPAVPDVLGVGRHHVSQTCWDRLHLGIHLSGQLAFVIERMGFWTFVSSLMLVMFFFFALQGCLYSRATNDPCSNQGKSLLRLHANWCCNRFLLHVWHNIRVGLYKSYWINLLNVSIYVD